MTVVAITPFEHGEADGTVTNVKIGEPIDGLSGMTDEKLQEYITGGSAIEVGRDRRFTNPESEVPTPIVDEDTAKRDALLAGQLTDYAEDGVVPQPAASNAAGSPGVKPED